MSWLWFVHSEPIGTWWAKDSPTLTWGSLKISFAWSGSTSTTERETQRELHKHQQIITSICWIYYKISRDLLRLCKSYVIVLKCIFCSVSLFQNIHQPGFLWIRACVCWRDKIWIRNHWFPQLGPVLPARKKHALGLQRIQGQGSWLSECSGSSDKRDAFISVATFPVVSFLFL